MCGTFWIMAENKIAIKDTLAGTWEILNMDCMLKH